MKKETKIILAIIVAQELFKEPYRLLFKDWDKMDSSELWIEFDTKLSPEEAQKKIKILGEIIITLGLTCDLMVNVNFVGKSPKKSKPK